MNACVYVCVRVWVGGCVLTAITRELFLARLLRAKASEAVVGVIWEIAKGPNKQVPITQKRRTSITGLSKWNQK